MFAQQRCGLLRHEELSARHVDCVHAIRFALIFAAMPLLLSLTNDGSASRGQFGSGSLRSHETLIVELSDGNVGTSPHGGLELALLPPLPVLVDD